MEGVVIATPLRIEAAEIGGTLIALVSPTGGEAAWE